MVTVYSRILTKCLLNRLWMCHYVIKRFVTQQKISSRNGIFFAFRQFVAMKTGKLPKNIQHSDKGRLTEPKKITSPIIKKYD